MLYSKVAWYSTKCANKRQKAHKCYPIRSNHTHIAARGYYVIVTDSYDNAGTWMLLFPAKLVNCYRQDTTSAVSSPAPFPSSSSKSSANPSRRCPAQLHSIIISRLLWLIIYYSFVWKISGIYKQCEPGRGWNANPAPRSHQLDCLVESERWLAVGNGRSRLFGRLAF